MVILSPFTSTKIDIRLVLPLRDVADSCLRRSHMSKQQPTSLDKIVNNGPLAHL